MIALDHLVLPVPELGEVSGMLEKAGFVVTPRAQHPFGTANRLVVFPDVYVELVEVADPHRIPDTGFASDVAGHLRSSKTGFSHFACRATTAAAAGEALESSGLGAGEPRWFSRPAPRSDGSELTASFTLVPAVSEPRLFFCIHHTPSAIWFRPHAEHPNGVRRIESVTAGNPPVVLGIETGPNRITFDRPVGPVTVSGVSFG